MGIKSLIINFILALVVVVGLPIVVLAQSLIISVQLHQTDLSPVALRVAEQIARFSMAQDINLIIDKATANIYVMRGNTIIAYSQFLYGRMKQDFFPGGSMAESYAMLIPTFQKMVTPAGVFPLKWTARDPDYGTSITFAQYKDYRLAIHRVYRGSVVENRIDRLNSVNVLDNNITSGCVNVSDEFYDQVLEKLKYNDRSSAYILPIDPSLANQLFFRD